jgi:RND family efflux transporter MFP subunit
MNKRRTILAAVLIGAALTIGGAVFSRLQEESSLRKSMAGKRPAPVEVAPIQRGPMEWRRTFSGTLEAPAQLVVSPKVSGRIERLSVDIGDTVKRGAVVAELDNDEYIQAVAQAEAELAVARANRAEAASILEAANRELKRIERLRKSGISSESRFDEAKADQLAKAAQLEVAKAQVTRAEALLAAAKIRLGYTRVTAGWTGGSGQRVVGERFVDEGATVAANARLLSIVELDPIVAVIFVTEKDYARLAPGQMVFLATDAYPDKHFEGRIARIAPVFRQATRQARVEVTVQNPDHRLKPGMFVRATVVLAQVPDATIVPFQALTTRNDRTGVFVVHEDGRSVVWREVRVGIREGERVQVEGEGLSGRVVTLGQQLVDDGSGIVIPENGAEAASTRRKG